MITSVEVSEYLQTLMDDDELRALMRTIALEWRDKSRSGLELFQRFEDFRFGGNAVGGAAFDRLFARLVDPSTYEDTLDELYEAAALLIKEEEPLG